MFCSQCAHKLEASDVYCPKCAKPIASFNFDPGQIPQVEIIGEAPTIVRPQRRSVSTWATAGGVAGVVFFGLALVLLAALVFVGYMLFLAPK